MINSSLLKTKKPIKHPQRLVALSPARHGPRLESQGDKTETLNRKTKFSLPPTSALPHQSVRVKRSKGDDGPPSSDGRLTICFLFLFPAFLFHLGFLGNFFPPFADKQSRAESFKCHEDIFIFSCSLINTGCEDNVVRSDEYIASGFNIFTTRRGCGKE